MPSHTNLAQFASKTCFGWNTRSSEGRRCTGAPGTLTWSSSRNRTISDAREILPSHPARDHRSRDATKGLTLLRPLAPTTPRIEWQPHARKWMLQSQLRKKHHTHTMGRHARSRVVNLMVIQQSNPAFGPWREKHLHDTNRQRSRRSRRRMKTKESSGWRRQTRSFVPGRLRNGTTPQRAAHADISNQCNGGPWH